MPGPGSRSKAKSKRNNPKHPHRQPRPTWTRYTSPKLTMQKGGTLLCTFCVEFSSFQVHANFNAIYARIDKVYQRNMQNYKIRGAIIGIFAKMCVDSLLRNKLFDKGILNMIIPLLNVDDIRHLALRALSTITHHGGVQVRVDIAKHSNVLAKLIRDLPDDDKVAELGVVTLAHSISAVVGGDEKPANPTVLKSINMADVLKTVLEAVKRPYNHPRSIIDHAVELVAMSSMHAASSFKTYTPAINFLVAGLRSKDWVMRCTCLGGLIRLYRLEAEDDQRHLDPQKLMSAMRRGLPNHLIDLEMDYGHMRCDIYLTVKSASEFQQAMMSCMQTHDLYALGLKEAELILKTEFSISEGMFEVEDHVTKRRSHNSGGLPFKMWSESLPLCAKAIRKMRKPAEEDMADILDIKYLIMKQRVPDAVSFAKKAIERNPQQAYFYYAITLSADNVQGLRAAKKGLKCKLLTPFVKWQMMQRAVQHAGDMGVKILQEMPKAGEQKWEEGIAFLMSALEDAKVYLDGAPPDNRHMKNVGYWFVLLTMLTEEDLSPDLRELNASLEKLKAADEFSHFVGIPPPKTNLRLAQQAAVKHYPAAVKEFSRVYDELDKSKGTKGSAAPRQDKLEDDLAVWLDDMKLDDGTIEDIGTRCPADLGRPNVNYEHITLYRCSWCGNPSAALKKCSGCSKTRYCDSACQKSHWSEHKKMCKA